MPATKKLISVGRIQTVHREKKIANRWDAAISLETVFSGKEPKERDVEARYDFPDDKRLAYKAIFRKGSICYLSGVMRKENGKSVYIVDDLIGTSRTAIDLAKQKLNENPNTLREKIIAAGGFSIASKPEMVVEDYGIISPEVRCLQQWLADHNLPFDLDFAWAANTFFASRAVNRSPKDGLALSVLGLIKKNPLMLADFAPELSVTTLIKAFSTCKDIKISKEMELMARVSETLFRASSRGHSCLPLQRLCMRHELMHLMDEMGIPQNARAQKITELARLKLDYRAGDIVFDRYGLEASLPTINAYYAEKLKPYKDELVGEELRKFNQPRAVPTWMAGKLSTFAYLPKLFFSERNAAEELAIRIKAGCTPIEWKLEYATGMNAEQIDAVKAALANPVSVIIGGAGTGKTFVIQRIAKIAEEAGREAIVLAPTATAAANACRGGEIQRYATIHRFAKILPDADDLGTEERFSLEGQNVASNAVVIVDEMSMCTVPMLCKLLKAIKNAPSARLVLVGDDAQLPAVGADSFRAFASGMYRKWIPVTRLVKNYRSRSAILAFANGIRKGEFSVPESDQIAVLHKTAKEFFTEAFLKEKLPMVLAPTRREQRKLNTMLRPLAGLATTRISITSGRKSLGIDFFVGDPVIATRNDYYDADEENLLFATKGLRHTGRKENIYNGTCGTIESYDEGKGEVMIRLFPPEAPQEGFLLPYNAEEIPLLFEAAYAMTAHKAQGQERDVVVFVATDENAFIRRSMLYTVATRAKKEIFILGRKDFLAASAKAEEEEPLSMLPFRFLAKMG